MHKLLMENLRIFNFLYIACENDIKILGSTVKYYAIKIIYANNTF